MRGAGEWAGGGMGWEVGEETGGRAWHSGWERAVTLACCAGESRELGDEGMSGVGKEQGGRRSKRGVCTGERMRGAS